MVADPGEPLDDDAWWTCLRCAKANDPSFEVCWNCGATPDGQADPHFASQRSLPEVWNEEWLWSPPYFSFRQFLAVMAASGLVLAVASIVSVAGALIAAIGMAVMLWTARLLGEGNADMRRSVLTLELVVVFLLVLAEWHSALRIRP